MQHSVWDNGLSNAKDASTKAMDATHESNIRCESNVKRAADVEGHPLFTYTIPDTFLLGHALWI